MCIFELTDRITRPGTTRLWDDSAKTTTRKESFIYRQSPIFSYVTKTLFSHNANMATFIALRHPVTILVIVFTNPENLTNDLLILKLLIINRS